MRIFHQWRRSFFRFLTGEETELGQAVAEGLQFDGGLARVRIRDAAGEQIGVIGEDMAAFAATRDGDVKLFPVDGGEREGDVSSGKKSAVPNSFISWVFALLPESSFCPAVFEPIISSA